MVCLNVLFVQRILYNGIIGKIDDTMNLNICILFISKQVLSLFSGFIEMFLIKLFT